MQDLGRYVKRTHLEIQTRYFSFLIVGSVALVGLVFALGVLVGSRQQGHAECPQPDALATLDLQSNEPLPPSTPMPTRLSFHDSLTQRGEVIPTPASLRSSESDGIQSEDGKLDLQGGPLVRPKLAEAPIPEAVAQDEPGSYSLQVGSFQDRREATSMVRKLERAGHSTFLVSVEMPERGGTWYRVRVGPFSSKREAWSYKKQFEEQERLPAFVVKRRAAG